MNGAYEMRQYAKRYTPETRDRAVRIVLNDLCSAP